MIKLIHVKKDYTEGGVITNALKDINLEVKDGEFVAIMGASGSGKSTLLPQKAPLHTEMTVDEYLYHCADIRLMPKKEIPKAMERAKEKCGITHFSKRQIRNLSGGYQQRVGIAQAIIHNPLFVILDEPTNGLDPTQIVEIRRLIWEISGECLVMLSTHILHELQLACHRILMMADRWRDAELRGSRILEMLLNYIVTPALLIYAAILYLYMAKILVTWTLPEGGVAYLVFGFTMTALAVKALGRLLEKRIYDWFFDRFSLVSLPVLALFWIGVVRRTNEYGLTEPRVYLVVCGGLMTLCVLLFLSQRTGRYLWVCLAAWVSFAALAYVPFLEPERIAVQSQTQRAERVAERLGRLGGDGRLLLTPMPLADTVYKKEYRKLYESLDYIRRDSAAFARFGVKDLDDLAAIFPEAMRDYVRWGYDWSCVDTCVDTNIIELEAPVNVRFEVNAEYPHYYTNLRNWYNDHSYDVSNDTLRLFLGEECAVYRISCRDLLERQLERSGFDPAEACEPAPEQLLRLLDYRDDRCRILFENIKLERTDSAVVIQGMAINAVLMR